jgi:hypothetical protein
MTGNTGAAAQRSTLPVVQPSAGARPRRHEEPPEARPDGSADAVWPAQTRRRRTSARRPRRQWAHPSRSATALCRSVRWRDRGLSGHARPSRAIAARLRSARRPPTAALGGKWYEISRIPPAFRAMRIPGCSSTSVVLCSIGITRVPDFRSFGRGLLELQHVAVRCPIRSRNNDAQRTLAEGSTGRFSSCGSSRSLDHAGTAKTKQIVCWLYCTAPSHRDRTTRPPARVTSASKL